MAVKHSSRLREGLTAGALATPCDGPGAGRLTLFVSWMVFPGAGGFWVKRAGVKKRSLAGHVSEDA